MKITNHLSIDMVYNSVPAVVDVMQGDEGSRSVAVSLYAAGVPWIPPSAAVASVSFVKPDKTSGWYDTLPDETAACTVDGNIVTAVLVPEVTQLAGDVICVITFRDESTLAQISAFPFTVRVIKNPAAGNTVSNSYYKVQTLEQINNALDGKADRALPHFDLAAMGLPALAMDGTEQAALGIDTTDIASAARNGDLFVSVFVNASEDSDPVTFKVPMIPVSTGGGTGNEIKGEISWQSRRYLLRVLIFSDHILATVSEVEAGSSTLTGTGAPTTATVGQPGQLYMDTDTGDLYKCIGATNNVYTWDTSSVMCITFDRDLNCSHDVADIQNAILSEKPVMYHYYRNGNYRFGFVYYYEDELDSEIYSLTAGELFYSYYSEKWMFPNSTLPQGSIESIVLSNTQDIAPIKERIGYVPEGYSANYFLSSPGWKRVAVLIRSNSGIADIHLAVNSQPCGRTFQNIMIGYSGYVDMPSTKNGNYHPHHSKDLAGKPQIFQILNHSFGEDADTTDAARIFRIDKVRLSWPKSYDCIESKDDTKYSNPVNIYLDVHIAADDSVDWSTAANNIQFMLNLTGKCYNHNTYPITEETNCDEPVTGIDGVLCDSMEFTLKENTGFYMPQYSEFDELCVDTLYSREVSDYAMNSGTQITGRTGSNKLLSLIPADTTKPHNLLAMRDNLIIDDYLSNYSNSGVSVIRYPNGIYHANGVPSANNRFGIFAAAKPSAIPLHSCPILLKANTEYILRDGQIAVASVSDWNLYLQDPDNHKIDNFVTYYYGTSAEDRITPQNTVIPAAEFDRVVVIIGIFFRSGIDYTDRCFYPQLCRADVGVIETEAFSKEPWSVVTREKPYSPRAFTFTGSISGDDAPDIAYARELQLFSDKMIAHGTAQIEAATEMLDKSKYVKPEWGTKTETSSVAVDLTLGYDGNGSGDYFCLADAALAEAIINGYADVECSWYDGTSFDPAELVYDGTYLRNPNAYGPSFKEGYIRGTADITATETKKIPMEYLDIPSEEDNEKSNILFVGFKAQENSGEVSCSVDYDTIYQNFGHALIVASLYYQYDYADTEVSTSVTMDCTESFIFTFPNLKKRISIQGTAIEISDMT